MQNRNSVVQQMRQKCNGSIFQRLLKILGLVFAGFAGGTLSPWILGWVREVKVETPGDAIAIANTYIVFTTIIFVGITVLLAIAGYVITQHFSAAKAAHETQIINEIAEKAKTEENLGINMINAILENPDVKQHVSTLLRDKLNEMLNAKRADNQGLMDKAVKQDQMLNDLAAQLSNGGQE